MQPNNQETCLCSAGIESMIQFDVVVLLLSFRCNIVNEQRRPREPAIDLLIDSEKTSLQTHHLNFIVHWRLASSGYSFYNLL